MEPEKNFDVDTNEAFVSSNNLHVAISRSKSDIQLNGDRNLALNNNLESLRKLNKKLMDEIKNLKMERNVDNSMKTGDVDEMKRNDLTFDINEEIQSLRNENLLLRKEKDDLVKANNAYKLTIQKIKEHSSCIQNKMDEFYVKLKTLEFPSIKKLSDYSSFEKLELSVNDMDKQNKELKDGLCRMNAILTLNENRLMKSLSESRESIVFDMQEEINKIETQLQEEKRKNEELIKANELFTKERECEENERDERLFLMNKVYQSSLNEEFNLREMIKNEISKATGKDELVEQLRNELQFERRVCRSHEDHISNLMSEFSRQREGREFTIEHINDRGISVAEKELAIEKSTVSILKMEIKKLEQENENLKKEKRNESSFNKFKNELSNSQSSLPTLDSAMDAKSRMCELKKSESNDSLVFLQDNLNEIERILDCERKLRKSIEENLAEMIMKYENLKSLNGNEKAVEAIQRENEELKQKYENEKKKREKYFKESQDVIFSLGRYVDDEIAANDINDVLSELTQTASKEGEREGKSLLVNLVKLKYLYAKQTGEIERLTLQNEKDSKDLERMAKELEMIKSENEKTSIENKKFKDDNEKVYNEFVKAKSELDSKSGELERLNSTIVELKKNNDAMSRESRHLKNELSLYNQLKDENGVLKNEMSMMTTKISTLNNEYNQLQNDYNLLNVSNENLKHQNQFLSKSKEDEIKFTKKQLEMEFMNEIENIKRQSIISKELSEQREKSMKKEREEFEKTIEKFQKSILEKEREKLGEIKSWQDKYDELEKEMRSILEKSTEKNEIHYQEIMEWTRQNLVLSNQIIEIEKENERIKGEKEELKFRIENEFLVKIKENEEEINRMIKENEMINERNKNIKIVYENCVNWWTLHKSSNLCPMEEEEECPFLVEELFLDFKVQEEERNLLKNVNFTEILKNQLNLSKNKFLNEINSNKEKLKSLKENLENSKQEIKSLKEEINSSKEKILLLTSDLEKRDLEINLNKNLISNLEINQTNLNEIKKDLEIKIDDLHSHILFLETNLKEKDSLIEETQKEIKMKKEENENLIKQISNLKDENENEKRNLNLLKEKNEKLKIYIEKLETKEIESSEELNTISVELKNTRKQLSQVKSENENYKINFESLNEKFSWVNQELKVLKEEKEILEISKIESEEIILNLKNEINEQEIIFNEIKIENENILNKFNSLKLENEIDRENQTKNIENLELLTNEINRLNFDKNVLNLELAKVRENFNETAIEYEKRICILESEIERLGREKKEMFEKERQEKFERERVIERELQEKIERERVMDRERIDKLANVEGGRDVVKIEKEMKDAIKDDKGREIPNDINPELIELFGRLIFQTNQRREIMKNLFDELKNNENFYRSNLENSQLALKDLKEKFEIYKIDSLKDLNENENISNEKIKNFIQEIEILNNSNNFFKSQIDSLNLQLNSLYNENKKLKNNGRNFNGNSFSKFVENFSGKSFSNSTGNATGNSIHATSPSADESSLLLKLQVKKLEDLIQSFTPSNNQTYSNHFTIRRLENQVNSLNRRLNMKSF